MENVNNNPHETFTENVEVWDPDNSTYIPKDEIDKLIDKPGLELDEEFIRGKANRYIMYLRSMYESIEKIIKESKDVDGDIDHLDVLKCIINDESDFRRYKAYDTFVDYKLVSIMTNILENTSYVFGTYKVISKKYERKPIFTQQQIAAANGNPELIWKLQAKQDMEALNAQMGILDKLISLIMWLIGIRDNKDEKVDYIIKYYKFDQPSDSPIILLESIRDFVLDVCNLCRYYNRLSQMKPEDRPVVSNNEEE